MLKGIVNDVPKDIIRIPMKGKNLFDGTKYVNTSINNPERWEYSTSLTGSVYRVPCKPNTTYTLYLAENIGISIWRIRDVSTNDVPNAQSTSVPVTGSYADSVPASKSATFTTSASAKYILFQVNETAYVSVLPVIMLIEGTTKIPYEPYGMQNGWEVRDQQGTILWGADKTLTGTDSISFKGYGLPLKSWTVQGNTQQQGTPTPSAPIQPQETGERTAQMIPYPYELPATETSGVTFSVDSDGRITATGRTTANLTAVIRYNIGMLTAGTYTFSVTGKHEGLILYVRDMVAQATIANILSGSTSTSTTVTLADNTSNEIRVYMTRGVGYDVNFDCTVQLEKGSKATEHKPNLYAIPLTLGTTQNIYLQEPIRKIGDYADVASATGTSGVATRRIKKLVLDGVNDGEWKKSSTRTGSFYLNVGTNAIVSLGLCDRAVNVNTVNQYDSIGQMLVESSGVSKLINLWLFDTNISLDDFKSYLAAQHANGTPVTVWYVLATPTEETFTAPILTPANGNNTLTVDTTLPPSGVSITGHVK